MVTFLLKASNNISIPVISINIGENIKHLHCNIYIYKAKGSFKIRKYVQIWIQMRLSQ